MGTSLVVQWLGLGTSTAGGVGSITGRGTKIPNASAKKKKKKKVQKIKIKKKENDPMAIVKVVM